MLSAVMSSRNDELTSILNNKKRIVVFNKSSLADDGVTVQNGKNILILQMNHLFLRTLLQKKE